MSKKIRSSFTRTSNEESNEDDKNCVNANSEDLSIKKIRSILYEESINFSDKNTYYKSSNIHNYNNIDTYMDYIKKSNYARSYEQENIYNQALNLYNNRNVYIKKKYRNDLYYNMKRDLKGGHYFGDDVEYMDYIDNDNTNDKYINDIYMNDKSVKSEYIKNEKKTKYYIDNMNMEDKKKKKHNSIKYKSYNNNDDENYIYKENSKDVCSYKNKMDDKDKEFDEVFLEEIDDDINIEDYNLIHLKYTQALYDKRKKEQSIIFYKKYKELFGKGKTNLKNGNDISNRKKSLKYTNEGHNYICKRNEEEIYNNNYNNNNTDLLTDIKELNSMSESNSYNEKEENFLEQLIKLRYTPDQITQLSDLFENPKTLKTVNVKILNWLNCQLNNGYWLERFSLFLLGLTIAIGVGNIETIWFLMSTWHGVIFIVPYILCYFFVCHPILTFELYIGQLVRTSTPFIFYRLLKPCASVGFLMVLACLINSYINSYRTASEYFIYLINCFKKDLPWKLNKEEIKFCTDFKNDFVNCHSHRPLCLFSKQLSACVPNSIGKAFLIYHKKFFPNNKLYNFLLNISDHKNYINIFSNGDSYFDKDSLIFLCICNFLVTSFQLFGLTNFAFSAALVLLLIGFLSITQFATMINLNSASQAYSHVLKSWNFSYLYTYSSIWSQCVSFALYELSIGMGIYSSLATKTRIGTNLAFDGYAITTWNSIISSLMFFSAIAVIGFISKSLNSHFVDILEFSRSDCSFILFPVGFTYLKKMEKTLCMLYYGSYAVLSCASLAIQCEVIVMTIKDFKFCKNIKKRNIILLLSILFFISSFFISNSDAKNIIWFLNFTISENGRVFVSLLICIILGWFYNTEYQFKNLTTKSVLFFNITYWVLNIMVSIIFNYLTYHVYVLYLCRILIFLISTIFALLVLKAEVYLNKGDLEIFYNRTTYKNILYILYIGNIETLRKELQRIISGNVFIGNISIVWSICIKYIGTSILLSAFIEFADGIFYSNEIKEKVKIIPKGWVFFSIFFWTFEKYCAYDDYFVDFSILPSKPLKEVQNFNILSYFYEFKNIRKRRKKKPKKIRVD
ncbi:transporter,putative [Plasmodium sp. gorilla clade G2]|uniref:transporter,putative n=1 Tax=Plasmodium sp. gorilla clade G2 TaxID=880535 RepID=UPI000D20C600|nr:transporter,putative [Plasmodium sp. gorilla clade G2]SOV10550.1 transporter,putative [Plasmodium sp. gorilla clade G2]